MAELVMWLFLILSVLAGAAIPVALKYQQRQQRGSESHAGRKTQKTEMKDIWEVDNIKQGLVIMLGGRYRMILRLAAADFFLLSEAEQNQVEDALAAVLMGLSFPVQFLTTSQAVDTRQAVGDVRENLFKLHENVKNYAREYAAYLEGLTSERTAAARSAYAVIPFETDKGPDYARTELLARAASLADGLRGCKIHCEVLDTPAVVDLLHHMLNRGSAWRPSQADTAGVMDEYHVSERQVLRQSVG